MPGARRPEPIFRRNLGRDVDAALGLANGLTDQLFALAVAIGQRGIDEVDARSMALRSAARDSLSVAPIHCLPLMPHAPYPISLTSNPVLPSFLYFIRLHYRRAAADRHPNGRKLEHRGDVCADIWLILLAIAACHCWRANFKLYMKDGGFQLVREYKVEGDRVQFYSVERSDWEEIPAALVDLKTHRERSVVAEGDDREAGEADHRRRRRRRAGTAEGDPENSAGSRRLHGWKTISCGSSSWRMRRAQRQRAASVLKALSPIPLMPGKATLEIPNEHSLNDRERSAAGVLSSAFAAGQLRHREAHAERRRADRGAHRRSRRW